MTSIVEQLLKMDAENRATPAGVVTRELFDGRWCADSTDGIFKATGKTRQEAIHLLMEMLAK